MAIHLLTAKQIVAASEGHLNDGGGLVLRITGDQGRWWFRYTSPGGPRRAMSLGTAAIRGETRLIDQGLRNAREVASEARSLLSRGQDPLESRDAGKAQAQKRVQEGKIHAQARANDTGSGCSRLPRDRDREEQNPVARAALDRLARKSHAVIHLGSAYRQHQSAHPA